MQYRGAVYAVFRGNGAKNTDAVLCRPLAPQCVRRVLQENPDFCIFSKCLYVFHLSCQCQHLIFLGENSARLPPARSVAPVPSTSGNRTRTLAHQRTNICFNRQSIRAPARCSVGRSMRTAFQRLGVENQRPHGARSLQPGARCAVSEIGRSACS